MRRIWELQILVKSPVTWFLVRVAKVATTTENCRVRSAETGGSDDNALDLHDDDDEVDRYGNNKRDSRQKEGRQNLLPLVQAPSKQQPAAFALLHEPSSSTPPSAANPHHRAQPILRCRWGLSSSWTMRSKLAISHWGIGDVDESCYEKKFRQDHDAGIEYCLITSYVQSPSRTDRGAHSVWINSTSTGPTGYLFKSRSRKIFESLSANVISLAFSVKRGVTSYYTRHIERLVVYDWLFAKPEGRDVFLPRLQSQDREVSRTPNATLLMHKTGGVLEQRKSDRESARKSSTCCEAARFVAYVALVGSACGVKGDGLGVMLAAMRFAQLAALLSNEGGGIPFIK
ncbi:hypothetical protein ACFX13_015074 [Malus domestica]